MVGSWLRVLIHEGTMAYEVFLLDLVIDAISQRTMEYKVFVLALGYRHEPTKDHGI